MVLIWALKKKNGLQLPQWAEANYDQFMKIKDLDYYFSFLLPEMQKLSAGIFRS
jgi:hypothetical protein